MHTDIRLFLIVLLFALSLFVVGCVDDDDPVTPALGTTSPDATGRILVDPNPDSLAAPWILSGPDDFNLNGSGDESLKGLSIGEYTLTWGTVAGWESPTNSTQTLVANQTVTFSCEYVDASGADPGFILLPPVSVPMPTIFTMGSRLANDETPHLVTLTGRFHMAETEVTNAQFVEALQWAYDQEPPLVIVTANGVYDNLDGLNVELLDLDEPGSMIGFSDGAFGTSFPHRALVEVTWYGAVSFCDWMSIRKGLPPAYNHNTWSCNNGHPYTAAGYRLPTEAEWEFACRAGTETPFNTGDCLDAGTEANYNGNDPYTGCEPGEYLGHPADVGSYPANQWMLYDIHGNVWEWCNDWYADYSGDESNPVGGTSMERIIRGGGWHYFAEFCRSAFRGNYLPFNAHYNLGFRVVRSVD